MAGSASRLVARPETFRLKWRRRIATMQRPQSPEY
jgi:hypothetical protein